MQNRLGENEKLVCEHGDFFCILSGTLTAYSEEGSSCKGEKYFRKLHRGLTRCGECGGHPGGHHVLFCSKERCPHCPRQLLACLARKYGFKDMADFDRKTSPSYADWT